MKNTKNRLKLSVKTRVFANSKCSGLKFDIPIIMYVHRLEKHIGKNERVRTEYYSYSGVSRRANSGCVEFWNVPAFKSRSRRENLDIQFLVETITFFII